jgi:hypothetical protein
MVIANQRASLSGISNLPELIKIMNKLLRFILEKAEEESLARRIEVYHELLLFLPRDSSMKKIREEITDLLERLEQVQNQSRQLVLSFSPNQTGI